MIRKRRRRAGRSGSCTVAICLYPSLESQLWNGLQMVEALNFVLTRSHPCISWRGITNSIGARQSTLSTRLHESKFDWLGDNYRFDTGDAAADALLQFEIHVRLNMTQQDDRYFFTDVARRRRWQRSGLRTSRQELSGCGGARHRRLRIARRRSDNRPDALVHGDGSASRETQRKHPTLAFVVGGHDHEPEFSELNVKSSAAVMKGASNARAIWRIDVNFDDDGCLRQIDVHMLNLGEGCRDRRLITTR